VATVMDYNNIIIASHCINIKLTLPIRLACSEQDVFKL